MALVQLKHPLFQDAFRTLGDLFSEVTEGTLVWNEPTKEQKQERKARRRRLLENSHIPWIVSDLGALLQFYDDAQDIVAFSRWNRKLFSSAALRACMGRCVATGRHTASECFFRCVCGVGRPGKRRMLGETPGWGLVGAAAARGLATAIPPLAAVSWVALAGQVAYTMFGVGIKLGPLVGAALELFFRGLDAVGLPFGPEHNKYHQLLKARTLQQADKGLGAAAHLGPGEWLQALIGVREAGRDNPRLPPHIWDPENYPSWKPIVDTAMQHIGRGDLTSQSFASELFRDGFDTFRSVASLGLSLPGNMEAWFLNDFLNGFLDDARDGGTFDIPNPLNIPDSEKSALIARMHANSCPGDACKGAIEDQLNTDAWTYDPLGGRSHPERGSTDQFPTGGGLFTPR